MPLAIEKHLTPKEYTDLKQIASILLLLLTAVETLHAQTAVDSLSTSRNWWDLLWRGELSLSDPTVEYPKFLGFCVNTYNVVNRAINTHDTAYVVETDKTWKIQLLFDNWSDSYNLNPSEKMPITMISNPYSNVGVYLHCLGVSAGYSIDLQNVLYGRPTNHGKWDIGLACALFKIEYHQWNNTGGSIIRRFGKYNNGEPTDITFTGARQRTHGVSGYYVFNSKRYSHQAGYNFSKFQLKNAGGMMLGFLYDSLDIDMNMNELPEFLTSYLTIAPRDYKFHYRTANLLCGYGFNWVWNKHLMYNITCLPGIGITNTYDDSFEQNLILPAVSIKAMNSLTYNNKDFFICAVGKIDGNWYRSSKFSLLSTIPNANLSVGIRF